MQKKWFGLALISLFSAQASAQYPSDGLYFSDLQPFSTARSAALGNAMGAIGGDASTLSINPAGLGIYRRGELSISPSLFLGNTETNFAGRSFLNKRTAFNLGNVAAIFSVPLPEEDHWTRLNFGFGWNRLANFNRSLSFDGSTFGSRIVSMVEAANGNTPDLLNPYENQLAYDAYLIDLDGSGSGITYVGAATDSNFIRKQQTVQQSGGMNELAISVASSRQRRFFLGFTLGIPFVRFRDNRAYQETEETDNIDFKELQFKENRFVRGTGLNFKLGIIQRLGEAFRLGAHIHTPTFYRLKEDYSTELYGRVIYNDTLRTNILASPEARFEHHLLTPWLFGASAGLVAENFFWSLDAEWLNYRSNSFSLLLAQEEPPLPEDEAFIQQVNNDVRILYKGAWRVRTGLEFVLEDMRLRLGYRLQTSPYRQAVPGVSDFRHDFSGGFGIRKKNFFVDLSYTYTLQEFEYLPYPATALNIQQVLGQQTGHHVMLTIGYNFAHPEE